MDIVIAPISGQHFVNQIAAYLNLLKYKYKPQVTLSASGGAVTSTMAMISNYDYNSMIRNVSEVNSSRFVSSWVPEFIDFIPSGVVGIFQGSLYKHSDDVSMRDFIKPVTLRDHEIWIMAYCLNNKAPALFCSTSSEKSFLQSCSQECSINQSKIFQFLNGDVKTYYDAMIASSSVPTVVPYKEINKKYYADGGMIYASPFIPFRNQIETLESFHLLYINGRDLDAGEHSTVNPDYTTLVNTTEDTTTAIVNSCLIQDRYTCYTLIQSKGVTKHEDITLDNYFKRKSEWQYSLMEMYPVKDCTIDFTNFTSQELMEKVEKQISQIGCRVWYVEKM